MPLINHSKKEINAKLIYFGPASGGKATSLQYVYSKLKESTRGIFKSMTLQNDRMLFFDFMPSSHGNMNGYNIHFHVYTLTGEVKNPASWNMVLKGVDGLVFVADSSPGSMSANIESFKSLNASLAAYCKTLGEIPCVIQCNKQDLAQALSPAMIENKLAHLDSPLFPAVADRGEGVLESIFALIKLVLRDIRAAGIEMEEQPPQFMTASEPLQKEIYETAHIADTFLNTGASSDQVVPEPISVPVVTVKSSDNETGIARIEEPFVEVAGSPEILEGGGVLLPLAIKYGGKVKLMKLSISISPSVD